MCQVQKDQKDQKVLPSRLAEGKYRVYTKLEHVSRSGMSRSISLYVAIGAGEIVNITYDVANLLQRNLDRYGGIPVKGAGFDAGHDIVYRIALTLWNDPHKLKHTRL